MTAIRLPLFLQASNLDSKQHSLWAVVIEVVSGMDRFLLVMRSSREPPRASLLSADSPWFNCANVMDERVRALHVRTNPVGDPKVPHPHNHSHLPQQN